MATMKTISAALKLVDSKKENLRKAFEDLQAKSSSIASFNLNWSDLDSYFTSSKSSLEHKFNLLQSQQQKPKSQSQQKKKPKSKSQHEPPQPKLQKPNSQSQQEQTLIEPSPRNQSDPEPESAPEPPNQSDPEPASVAAPARPELKSFCEKMDGPGLKNYILDQIKEWKKFKPELPKALRCAPEPATLVLDSVVGFYVPGLKGDKNAEAFRSCCVIMLEELVELKVEVGAELKERAKVIAEGWREKWSADGGHPFDTLAFLSLVAAYGLRDEFQMEDLIGYAVNVAKFRQGIKLCRAVISGDRISDVIEKLISEGKKLLAVRFICEFGLAEKFPTLPLLRAYVKECKKDSARIIAAGQNKVTVQNNARYKEIMSLKSAIKVIDDYKLECPKGFILKRLNFLEKEKSVKEGAAHQQQSTPKNLSGNKRPRTPATHSTTVAGASSSVPALEQSRLQQPAGYLLEAPPAAYLSAPSGPYGSAGVTPASASYGGGLYGYAGQPVDIHRNMMPAQPHAYPPLHHVPAGYVEGPTAYGGYGLPPPYHQPFYPQ